MPSFIWMQPEELKTDTSWWEIYHSSFPTMEQDTPEQILFSLENKLARVGRHRENNQTIALAIVYDMQTLPISFLNYFAVAKPARGLALGSHLFKKLLTEISAYAHPTKYLGLYWEVEDPSDATNEQEKSLRERRIAFYTRHQADMLLSRFIQPPIDGEHTINMRLMHSGHQSMQTLALEKAITECIYLEKYHAVNGIAKTVLAKLLEECFGN